MKQYRHILLEVLNQYLRDNLLLTEDQERTIRNKIARGVAATTQMDVTSQEVQSMADDIWNTYVKHPIEGEKRQNDEVWAINTVISRLIPYAVRKNADGGFFVNKSPRVKQAFENLIQAQRKEQKSKNHLWLDDESLHHWNANKKYNDAMEAAKDGDKGKYHYSVFKICGYGIPIKGLGINVIELGKYTGGQGKFSCVPLCYTQSDGTYNQYTSNNKYDMYALLRDGWKNEPCEIGEDYPLDSYGLSIIFVIIDENGKIAYSNVRWNHGPRSYSRSVDHIFSFRELSEIVGSDVMYAINVTTPIEDSIRLTKDVETFIKEGSLLSSVESIADKRFPNINIIYYKGKKNCFDTENNELLSDRWFDFIASFSEEGIVSVCIDNKWNYMKLDGSLVLDTENINEWFDRAGGFSNGFGTVIKNNKQNFIRPDGTFVWDRPEEEWLDDVEGFYNGCAKIQIGKVFNYLKQDGSLVIDTLDTKEWLSTAWTFDKNGSVVSKRGLWNVLTRDGRFLFDTTNPDYQFISVKYCNTDGCYLFERLNSVMGKYETFNIYDDSQMNFISKVWFDNVNQNMWNTHGIIALKSKNKFNFFGKYFGLLFDEHIEKWADAYSSSDGNSTMIISRNGKSNILSFGHGLISDEWFDMVEMLDIYSDDTYYFRGIINGKLAKINLYVALDKKPKIIITDDLEFDSITESQHFKDWRIVKLGGNYNYIDSQNHFVFDTWFNRLDDSNTLPLVEVRQCDHYNFITKQGKLLFDFPISNWLIDINRNPISDGFYIIKNANYKFNILTTNCKILFEEWLDSIIFFNGTFELRINYTENLLYKDETTGKYKLAWNAPIKDWFAEIYGPVEGKYRYCKGEFWVTQRIDGKPEKILAVKDNKILGEVTT